MTVYDREAKFKEIVFGVLNEVADPGLSVGFHLACRSAFSICSAEDEDGEKVGVLQDNLMWRLCLWVTPEDRKDGLFVSASIPYGEGTDETIEDLTRQLWEQYRFGAVMAEENLDETLEQVVTEVEGP